MQHILLILILLQLACAQTGKQEKLAVDEEASLSDRPCDIYASPQDEAFTGVACFNYGVFQKKLYTDGKLELEARYLYYDNGNLLVESFYRDDKRNGSLRQYHENGQLKLGVNYKDDKREGAQLEYYDSGSLRLATAYKNDIQNGATKLYYEGSGKLKAEGFVKDGKVDGAFIDYYENGKIKMEDFYAAGKREGKHKEYYENGKLHIEANIVKGKRESQEVYYDSGMLYQKGSFDGNDKQAGQWLYYYESGERCHQEDITDGTEQHRGFYKSGEIESEYTRKKGLLDGVWRRYHENGQLLVEIYRKEGKIIDDAVSFYNSNGNVRLDVTFKDGDAISGRCYNRALTAEELVALNAGEAIYCHEGDASAQKEAVIISEVLFCGMSKQERIDRLLI